MPDLTANKKSNSKVLIKFSESLGEVIYHSTKNFNNVVVILTETTRIGNRWCPTQFSSIYQLKGVPNRQFRWTPFPFTKMIMYRTKIAHQSGHGLPQGIVQTICQVMLYNMTKNARYMYQIMRHSIQRETRLVIIISILISIAIIFLLNYAFSPFETKSFWFYKCKPPWMFPPMDIPFEYWILHVTFGLMCVMFRFSTGIFCKGVSGFATDCPCGVWCRGLTTCILYVGSLFGNLVWFELIVDFVSLT